MNRNTFSLSLLAWLLALPVAAEPSKPPSAQKPLEMADIMAWKSIRGSSLSNDGLWLAYTISPNEGDSELVVRAVKSAKEHRFPIGQGGFGGFTFSYDSRWLAFNVNPNKAQAKLLQQQNKPAQGTVNLLELATAKKTELDKYRRFAFNGEAGKWIALHKYPMPGQTGGTDLILRELGSTATELSIGNVSEFAFDKKGQWLALLIDAQGKVGNGVQLRNMGNAALVPLDTGKAVYKSLAWTEKGDAFAVLKGVDDNTIEGPRFTLLGFTGFAAGTPLKTVFDPKNDKTFPAGMGISPNRPATWAEDLSALLFGIQEVKKKEDRGAAKPGPKKETTGKGKTGTGTAAPPPRRRRPAPAPAVPAAKVAQATAGEKPDLVIWHWNDERLQSQQQKEAGVDKMQSYLCVYRVKEKRFLRLADNSLPRVVASPQERWAVGYDNHPYQLVGNLDGRRYWDITIVDMTTGERRLAVKQNRWFFGPSPEGSHFLYYNDGHFHTIEMATGRIFNITQDVPTPFFNDEDDHPVVKPPRGPLGWTKGGASVLLSDGWDVWNVPVHGGKAVNLTGNGRKDGLRYGRRFPLDPEEKGIDLSRPVYFSVYGEWTKKAGIVRLNPGKPGVDRLLWDDGTFSTLVKAKKADVFLYSRETYKDYPDLHAADATLKNGRRLTQANPQQDKVAWSAGCILVSYTSARGAKLQGALYLPANYEKGKRYPTIVYIYEKLSEGLNRYWPPSAYGFNKSVYTSHGYAVFMPDIVYQINDPGKSALWCVLPGLEAAVATGVVDRERVGLHGHSWGGYQTAFLITQTPAFKAAVAGAPLTNLISMYSSIYWNLGWANQPIFESSQGRFTSGYWDNLDAFIRNSPVFFAKNVKTPLLLLHNDKDGAVDWNQGIEYFNTLRRLRKPVVMLQYKGENHGLAKRANQKDYTRRMREFFDHYLKDKPAPGWLRDGVPHLKHEEHIKERLLEAAK